MTVITWNSCHKYYSIISQRTCAKIFPLANIFYILHMYIIHFALRQILLKSLVIGSVRSSYLCLIANVHKLQAFNEL